MIFRALLGLVVVCSCVSAFTISSNVRVRRSTKIHGFMDAMNKAMANDPNIAPAKNPGLSKEPETVEVVFKGRKEVKVNAYLGQKLKMIANAGRVPIKYSCEKGDCGTCEVEFNGKVVRACQATLPATSNLKTFTVRVK